MSEDEEESHCRLCAEPTPKSQLIAPDEDVGLNSKIAMKMLWINIDVSVTSGLPDSICFSCFDALQRTWLFLHAVRTAQTKLNDIYLKKVEPRKDSSDVKTDPDVAGNPVNVEWEEFEVSKQEVKPEVDDQPHVIPVDANTLLNLNIIKSELDTDGERNDSDGFNTSDSDLPLYLTAKKKIKKKKKNKVSYQSENDSDILTEHCSKLTWDDYMCRCADCDAQCKNIMSLRLHSLQIHAHCCIFKCSECGKVITSYKTFVNHVRTHKRLLRYCCEYCNECFLKTSNLKSHRSRVHKEAYSTTCHSCGSTFETTEQLQDHIILYTKTYRKRTVKKEKVDVTEDLKCEHCHKEFKSRSNLHQHKLVHTERSRDFSCHVCGKMFFTKGTLSTHMMTHDDAKPFKCEFCPMTFRARGNLQSHISLHSGAKPFVCEQCGKSFRVKRHLKSHSIIHTDLMPYVCNYCNKTFRFKTRLNLHLRQHTGAKPYNCVFCQRDFTNGSNYKKHMKRKHNIDTSSRKKLSNIATQYSNTNEQNLETSDIERN